MKNIKLLLEYDGSRFEGWSKQAGNEKDMSIQGRIEDVLSKMEGKEIALIGAQRTEANVHAHGQIANFKMDSDKKLYEIKHYLNRYLPRDIACLEVWEVPERFHSAYQAVSFTYEYKITMGEVASVFDRKYNYYSYDTLDIAAMKKAANLFLGKHDLRAFSDNKRMKKSTEREIIKLEVYGDIREISISITADDFWPHMARIIVGTLMEVGYGRLSFDKITEIIKGKDREKAGPTADAKGLFLWEINYV